MRKDAYSVQFGQTSLLLPEVSGLSQKVCLSSEAATQCPRSLGLYTIFATSILQLTCTDVMGQEHAQVSKQSPWDLLAKRELRRR